MTLLYYYSLYVFLCISSCPRLYILFIGLIIIYVLCLMYVLYSKSLLRYI